MLEKVTRVFWKGVRNVKHASPTLCTIGACVGVVGTVYLTSKATLRVNDILDDPVPEKKDIVKAAAPAAGAAIATIALIITSNILNKRQQATLLAAYLGAQETLKQYRSYIHPDEDKRIMTDIGDVEAIKNFDRGKVVKADDWCDDTKLFYYAPAKLYFEASEADVIAAEYEINHLLNYMGYVSVNEFLDQLDITEGIDPKLKDYGWDVEYLANESDMVWVNFYHRATIVSEDGLEAVYIDTFEPPILNGSYDYPDLEPVYLN